MSFLSEVKDFFALLFGGDPPAGSSAEDSVRRAEEAGAEGATFSERLHNQNAIDQYLQESEPADSGRDSPDEHNQDRGTHNNGSSRHHEHGHDHGTSHSQSHGSSLSQDHSQSTEHGGSGGSPDWGRDFNY